MFKDVKAIELPTDSKLQGFVKHGDFLDCYATHSPMPARQAAEIITDFPQWAQSLLLLRKVVTSPFGLSQDGPDADDKIGPFPVEHSSDEEVIAGFNDKHLNFRVSVIAKDGKVSLATWVHPHNIGGKFYLAAIMPFHILISRNALARVANTRDSATA
ncbi:MAG: DUF2867 domain-containing protein [Litoreibacter sp.]|uniref:DUF2867 domain-containing protein n=1 Tax=Litoreibacter sp. TaxID=1969459 RepID=UPI003296B9C3